MLPTLGRVKPFSGHSSAASKRHGRSFVPEIMGLESRVVLSTFTKPTPDYPTSIIPFTFGSDITAHINGYADIFDNTTNPTGYSDILCNDYYEITINPKWYNDFLVSFSINGLPTHFQNGNPLFPPGPQYTQVEVGFTVFNASTSGSLSYSDSRVIDTTDTSYSVAFQPTSLDLQRLLFSPVTAIYIHVGVLGFYQGPINTPSYTVNVGPSASSLTTTVLTSAPNPSAFGQSVTFNANVSPTPPGLPIPTGTVTFMDGLTDLGTGTLSTTNGVTSASFSTSTLAVGSHSITAVYGGDSNFSSSTSPAITQTVNSPTVQTQFQNTDALHKLLYAGEILGVNVSVANGSSQEIKGNEMFYLSSNQNASIQGDMQLTAHGNDPIDLQPKQSVGVPQGSGYLSVDIPNDIYPGTYYLKAVLVGNDDPYENSVAVSPALTTCVNSKGQVSSFATYPLNAAVYYDAVDVVKQGNPPVTSINSITDIEDYVKGWEGYNLKAYSDNGVPAIGYGSDLEDKATGQINATYEAIICSYIASHPNLHLTFQDFLDMNSNALIDRATAIKLFDAGFQTAQNYVLSNYGGTTIEQQTALIDIAYNIGTAGLANFTSMNADIAMGTPFGFACAGLELINSQRTTQIPVDRTLADFYLLTSSAGVVDQL